MGLNEAYIVLSNLRTDVSKGKNINNYNAYQLYDALTVAMNAITTDMALINKLNLLKESED